MQRVCLFARGRSFALSRKPSVSVVMSVYNGGPFVRRSVESILSQTFTDFEFIVVDDGSTDTSSEILASCGDPRVRLLRNTTNIGLTRSLNVGLRAAQGEFVARQDADDVSLPERLASQVAAFGSDRLAALIGTQARHVNVDGRPFDTREWRKCASPLAIEWQCMFENPFVHTSVMFRRDLVVDQLGGYDESFRTNQDFELWSRIVRGNYLTRNLQAECVLFRSRSGSLSSTVDEAAIQRVRGVFIENRAHSLEERPLHDRGLDILQAATNPRLRTPVRDLRPFTESLVRMHERFVALHPAAKDEAEIRVHCATLLSRVIRLVAPDAPTGICHALAATREYDSGVFRRAIAPAALRLLAGPVLRQRRRDARNRNVAPLSTGGRRE